MTQAPAPIAKKVPHSFQKHGRTFVDDYAWLQDKNDPEVIAYLEAENAYARAAMQHLAPLQDQLFQEMRGRIQEDDSSAPERRGDYLYYWRMQVAKLRAHKTDDNRLLLLTNMAAGHSGASGRYDYLRETAEVYAFLIDAVGAPADPAA